MRRSDAPHTDFGFLRGIIPTNPLFMPSNVDMMLERRGKFFIGEWKREGEEVSKGQKILLKNLANQPNFTVYVIDGYSDDTGTEVNTVWKVNGDMLSSVTQGIDGLKTLIRQWYALVEAQR